MKIKLFDQLFSKLNTALLATSLLATPMAACSSTDNDVFDPGQTFTLFNDLVNRDAQTHRVIRLAPDLIFPVVLEGTSKGNGTLKIHNLYLRVFDQHDDSVVYENSRLNIHLQDINGDMIKELILYGIVKYTGDSESDPARYETIIRMYSFSCKTGLFNILYQAGDFSPELPAEAVKPRVCK